MKGDAYFRNMYLVNFCHQFYVVGNEWWEGKPTSYWILTFTSGAGVASPTGGRMLMAHMLYFHGKLIKEKRKKGKCGSCTSPFPYSTTDLPRGRDGSSGMEDWLRKTLFSSRLFPASLVVACQLSNRVCSTLLRCKLAGSGLPLGRPVRCDTVDFNSREIVSISVWQSF